MPLSNGREYLAIPGPSVMPDRVLRAMHRAAPNIYEGDLIAMTASLWPDLRRLAGTSGKVVSYIGNGHAGWEAALSNTMDPGDRVLVLSTGWFGEGWAKCARRMGGDVELIDFGRRAPIDPNRVEEALRADTKHRIELVLMCFVDTSTSILNDVAAVRAAMDAAEHPALLMVDAIASLGCDEYHMDGWGVDVTLSASQKGLMTPPGMCFVWFNERAAARRGRVDCRSPYWDWIPRADPEFYADQFKGTAPTHHLYGLREALDMIAEEGIESVWRRHGALARGVWAAADAWGAGGPLEMNVADQAHRSHAVTALRVGKPHGAALRKWTAERAGVTLGVGLGMGTDEDPRAEGFFRIGHMGHVNAHMVLGALAVIEAGLAAGGVPRGSGAVETAAKAIADAAPSEPA